MSTFNKSDVPLGIYKKRIDFYTRTSPFELSYQRIIESLLETILENTGIEVIVSDRFARNGTQRHLVNAYKEKGTASPDLILAKKFSYLNTSDAQYIAFVEVKQPQHIKLNQDQNIVLNSHDSKQLAGYLAHQKIHKLIFTDCHIWAFYHNKTDEPIEKFDLRDALLNSVLPDEPEEWLRLQKYIREFLMDN